jgi:hypothetical protein
LADTPLDSTVESWPMIDDSDERVWIDLPESIFDLRNRASRARRHAAVLLHDEAAEANGFGSVLRPLKKVWTALNADAK